MRILFLIFFITCFSCGSTKTITTREDKTKNEVATEPEVKEQQEDILIEEVRDDVVIEGHGEVNPILDVPIEEDTSITPLFNHDLWNDLLKELVSKEGNVNYQGFKQQKNRLKSYITSLGNNMPTKDWSKEEKLAYWINAYNAMTIDLILRHYPIESIKDIKDPWKQRYWKLGEKWYNLDEIEHDILRKMNEPRIHFAIVCASFSCPKLQNTAFTSSNFNSLIKKATTEFLYDIKRNKLGTSKMQLSKIFKWFAKDFKQNGSLIEFLKEHANFYILDDVKITYLNYNWDLND